MTEDFLILWRTNTIKKKRLLYIAATLLLLAVEICIALFVHDRFIRPFIGDVLVVILIYTFIRSLIPEKFRLLPLWIFLFAAGVEFLQLMGIADVLFPGNRFFRILIGTSFDIRDILCYAVGSALTGVYEYCNYTGLFFRNGGKQKMKFNSLIPELSVIDIEKTKDFYLNVLSFRLEYERPEDKFIFISLEGNQLMLQQENDVWNVGEMEYPFGRGVNFEMTVSDVEGLYRKIIEAGITPFSEIKVSSYRENDGYVVQKEFLVQDPDGYLLRFTS